MYYFTQQSLDGSVSLSKVNIQEGITVSCGFIFHSPNTNLVKILNHIFFHCRGLMEKLKNQVRLQCETFPNECNYNFEKHMFRTW